MNLRKAHTVLVYPNMRLGLAFLAAKAVLPTALGYGFGFGFTQQNGQERLLGSSFGFPGTDQTFDYVVSTTMATSRPSSSCMPLTGIIFRLLVEVLQAWWSPSAWLRTLTSLLQ